METQRADSLISWIVGFIVSLQARYYIPDAAIDKLFIFLYVLFNVIGRFSPFMLLLSSKLPKSSYLAKKFLGLNKPFTKYVVCPKCWKLYLNEDAIEKTGSQLLTKRCSFIAFPNHTVRSRRAPCHAGLLKTVEIAVSGRKILYPHKIFCYRSLQSSIQDLLLSREFCEDCDHWRTKPVSMSYREVYDGQIWKNFQVVDGCSFLNTAFTYALTLNVDWFQPYKHSIWSVGVIYVTIMNLPRQKRYKRKNMVLIGVIPGPKEPTTHDMNSLLEPLVTELKEFWKGISLNVNTVNGRQKQNVRCALLCVACDLPAGRKVCGFLSHSASSGCSKCGKRFPGTVGSMNYSGFNRSLWPPRRNESHRDDVKKVQGCKIKTARDQKESQLGCRYSILLDLPYFDAPKMLAIDPMHNLFLGSAKHMISLWIKRGLINSCKFDIIQRYVDNMIVPCDVGRIPRKIEHGFSGFKADQFKSWTILFSIPALFDILPSEDLECWRHFVLACRILCKHTITTTDLTIADALLIQFCSRVEHLYGEDAVSPNMHLHGHLKECIQEYGPMQEFWLFSFERYNGILGKQPTNNREIESQLMNRFLNDNVDSIFVYPEEFQEDFKSVYESVNTSRLAGSDLDATTTINNGFTLPSRYSRALLSPEEVKQFEEMYSKYRNDDSLEITVNTIIFLKYSSITLKGREFRSSGKQTNNTAVAMASWDSDLFGDPPTELPTDLVPSNTFQRPVNVHYYMKVNVSVNSSIESSVFAYVSWFFPHHQRYAFGKPVELWCSSKFESAGMHSFLPLDQLISRCAHGIRFFHHERLLAVVPLVENVS